MKPYSKDKQTSRVKKSKRPIPERKKLEKQVEEMAKMLIFWRDGNECVQHETDGHRCGGNGLAWGHYISQKQSNWLRLDIGNFFVQCSNHNQLDFRGDKSYATWYCRTFGVDVAIQMERVRDEKRGAKRRTTQELQELLTHYETLYQNRYTAPVGDLQAMIQAGYYGEIVKRATPKKEMT